LKPDGVTQRRKILLLRARKSSKVDAEHTESDDSSKQDKPLNPDDSSEQQNHETPEEHAESSTGDKPLNADESSEQDIGQNPGEQDEGKPLNPDKSSEQSKRPTSDESSRQIERRNANESSEPDTHAGFQASSKQDKPEAPPGADALFKEATRQSPTMYTNDRVCLTAMTCRTMPTFHSGTSLLLPFSSLTLTLLGFRLSSTALNALVVLLAFRITL
jgi:hypothetical protein